MHIFIDESGSFTENPHGRHSVSAVGALIIPDSSIKGFEKLYGRLRKNLPKDKGEVKGRLLSELDVAKVVKVLKITGCLFEVVTADAIYHSEADLKLHKQKQEEAITAHLTDQLKQSFIDDVWRLRKELEQTPLQLYVQAVAMGELVYNTLFHADLYFAQRRGKELASYAWVIDAKNRGKETPWEKWWATVVLPMLESKSFRLPFPAIEGGDYRSHERFRTTISEYKKQFAQNAVKSEFMDLNMILKENFRFSSDPEFGLEAVDILVNAVRRSMAGNFQRHGWLPIRSLMIHKEEHYIRMISLAAQDFEPGSVPYASVLKDFTTGGRQMLTRGD